MIALDIPGFGSLSLEHVVLDFNGTLAEDGALLPGARALLEAIAVQMQVHVVTADTFNRAAAELAGLPVTLTVLAGGEQAQAKLRYVQSLEADRVVAIGNGRNDRLMLGAAALGIALIQREGGASEALGAAHIVACSIVDALDLLLNPRRLVATLRS